MHETHPPRDELYWYVTDGLACATRGWPSERMTAVERHVAMCDACSDALTRAARDEMVFAALAAEPTPTASRAAMAPLIGAALAVAALVFFVVLGATSAGESGSSSPGAATTTVDAGPWISADGDVLPSAAIPD